MQTAQFLMLFVLSESVDSDDEKPTHEKYDTGVDNQR